MKDFKAKDLRKAAFAVGFGLYFGKEAAKFLDKILDKFAMNLYKKLMVRLAKDGNEVAQAICKGAGVDFSNCNESEDFDPDERVMGFRA